MKKEIVILAVVLLVAAGAFWAKGKSYELMGYNEQGEQHEVSFTKSGSAKDYCAPGTYIKVSMSKTITLGVEVVEESSVPQTALEKMQELGTKAD